MRRRFASIAIIAAAMSSQTKNSMPELGVILETHHFLIARFFNELLAYSRSQK
jgi:hypothetical protein